jgi:hypothetical protein
MDKLALSLRTPGLRGHKGSAGTALKKPVVRLTSGGEISVLFTGAARIRLK